MISEICPVTKDKYCMIPSVAKGAAKLPEKIQTEQNGGCQGERGKNGELEFNGYTIFVSQDREKEFQRWMG